jgi:hypothetical protein
MGNDRSIRFAADIPLEWSRFDGVPLVLRHFTSRLPVTPGNLFSQQALNSNIKYVNIDRVESITVIRTLGRDDKLYRLVESCLGDFSTQEGWRLQFKFVDVPDEKGFIDACNACDGPFVIIDGHGSHSPKSEVGGLQIGGTPVDIWSLRGKVLLPPIVILSICDAHPVDRSHASIANGFLSLDAMSVFASMLPIDGVRSAIMMARLLYRVTSITKHWIDLNKVPLAWLKVVSCQLRASYVFDVLQELVDRGELSKDASFGITVKVTNMINWFQPNWYQMFLSELATALDWGECQVTAFLNNEFLLNESLLYLQLGVPDKVMLVTDRCVAKMQLAGTE